MKFVFKSKKKTNEHDKDIVIEATKLSSDDKYWYVHDKKDIQRRVSKSAYKLQKKKFTIVMKSGERHEVSMKSEEALLRWLSTGVAGIVPMRDNYIRLKPDEVREIIVS